MCVMTSRGRVVKALNHEEPDRADGAIDVRKISDPEAFAEARDAKLPAAKREGGYIDHSDHSVPGDVSFPACRKALEIVRERG